MRARDAHMRFQLKWSWSQVEKRQRWRSEISSQGAITLSESAYWIPGATRAARTSGCSDVSGTGMASVISLQVVHRILFV